MNAIAMGILIVSITLAAGCLAVAGVGIYRFSIAWRRGQEEFW